MPSQPQSTGSGWEEKESISRTMIYKKVTKPLLERQRRARINRCLDELKELMSSALAAEGENLTKLEKADVLELTVRHLHQLQREGELSLSATASGLFGTPLHPRSGLQAATSGSASTTDRRRYQGGFIACAQQVASYVMKNQDLEPGISQRLLAHLARCAQQLSDFPAAPTMPQPFPVPGPAPEAPTQFLPFPAQEAVFPARPEYAITAQFQLYRNKPDIPPSTVILSPPVLADPVKSEEKPAEATKRKLESPEIPKIPKKRYAHSSFQDREEETAEAAPSAEPVPGTSRGTIYVVESKILEVPRPTSDDSEDDAANRDENMWRPW